MPKVPKTSLQNLCNIKEKVKNEIDLLPTNKYQSFLQIDVIILGVCGQACPNYPK